MSGNLSYAPCIYIFVHIYIYIYIYIYICTFKLKKTNYSEDDFIYI